MIWGYLHDSGNLHLDQIEFSKNTLGAHGQFQSLSAETLMETPLRPIFKIEPISDMVINGTTVLPLLLVLNPAENQQGKTLCLSF
jgi:hypothetical protein